MSEIKSTLDLVMEKTKHLSLTEKEKEGQQRQTYERRLKGLVQKYAEGFQSLEDFQSQLRTIQETLDIDDTQPLIGQILNQVDPDQDNTHWLNLLDEYMGDLRNPLQEILTAYAQQRAALSQAGLQRLMDQLRSEHRIRGSAVRPNLDRDRVSKDKITMLRQETLTNIANLY